MLIVWPYMPSHWSAQHLGLDNALKEFAPGCMPHPASAPQRRVHALPTILKQGALAWNSRALPWAWTQWSNRCSGCPGARATAWKQTGSVIACSAITACTWPDANVVCSSLKWETETCISMVVLCFPGGAFGVGRWCRRWCQGIWQHRRCWRCRQFDVCAAHRQRLEQGHWRQYGLWEARPGLIAPVFLKGSLWSYALGLNWHHLHWIVNEELPPYPT